MNNDMDQILDKYKEIVVQIATPFSTGTGFILTDNGYIITNEHVVRDNKTVVVQTSKLHKRVCRIIFIDQKYDIAILQYEDEAHNHTIEFSNEIRLGQEVIAIGHPLGLQYSVTKGIISSLEYQHGGISYLQHDAALSPGNSGGPLLDNQGQLVGINSFIVKNGLNIGLSLPSVKLLSIIAEFNAGGGKAACRCMACETIIFEEIGINEYCNVCGDKISPISLVQDYLPIGMSKKIEEILDGMNISPDLCRRGPHCWEILHGSAKINISYHEKSGYIVLDAHLCRLTKENVGELYMYLLQQNYYNQGITFSVKDENIILSLMIYDQYLNVESAKKMFSKLFKAADQYDDVLVNKFGASWV